jgi:hypothetical protein
VLSHLNSSLATASSSAGWDGALLALPRWIRWISAASEIRDTSPSPTSHGHHQTQVEAHTCLDPAGESEITSVTSWVGFPTIHRPNRISQWEEQHWMGKLQNQTRNKQLRAKSRPTEPTVEWWEDSAPTEEGFDIISPKIQSLRLQLLITLRRLHMSSFFPS